MPDYLAIARPGEVWGETGPQARQLQSLLGGKRVGPVQESQMLLTTSYVVEEPP